MARTHHEIFHSLFLPPSHSISLSAYSQELWRLDLGSWEWDLLPLKGGPSARSGHRMVAHKGRIILFGGYFDNGRDMR